MKKIWQFIKNIWNDGVWGAVIAFIICSLGTSIFSFLGTKIPSLKKVFLLQIPIYVCFIEFVIFLFIILRFIVHYRINKKDNNEKQVCINELNKKIQELEIEITDLKKEPDNPRMALFKNGDVVIIKNSPAFWNVIEYTVVGKKENLIVISDSEGNQKMLPPDALLTADEYKIEKQRQENEYNKLLNRNRNTKPWLW